MLGEKSTSAAYWSSVGREAIKHGVKRVIMMGAHWEVEGDHFEVAANTAEPKKQPVAWVDPTIYQNYSINVDPELAQQVVEALKRKGLKAKMNSDVEWIHDSFLVLIHMFPKKSLPVTLISSNAYYDPAMHIAAGEAVREFRAQDTLIIGSGGAVHNLYRNNWQQIFVYRDNFAQERPPAEWALEFGQAVEDAITKNSGPELRRAITRLMRHPLYRDAQATEDHFIPLLFVAGAAGHANDIGTKNRLTAVTWELEQMQNSQFQLGDW